MQQLSCVPRAEMIRWSRPVAGRPKTAVCRENRAGGGPPAKPAPPPAFNSTILKPRRCASFHARRVRGVQLDLPVRLLEQASGQALTHMIALPEWLIAHWAISDEILRADPELLAPA